ncbi:hypothetical protein BS46_gp119 [Acinetobacter phage BS46]|nr:hypothetical protein BS46_gp119 [Acinetobacter phage BS46]
MTQSNEAMKLVGEYLEIKKEYQSKLSQLTSKHIEAYAEIIGKNHGNFALVVRGTTPTWNDGDECTHSYDYSLVTSPNRWGFDNDDLYIYDRFDGDDVYTELFEYDEENKTTINTRYANNQSFEEGITNFASFIDDVNDTNYEVRVKYKDGVVSYVSEYCDPDY